MVESSEKMTQTETATHVTISHLPFKHIQGYGVPIQYAIYVYT